MEVLNWKFMVGEAEMKVHENKGMKIKDWMEFFKELYSQADSKRTPEQMWIAVMAHTSHIGESIRRGAFESLLNSAAHTFCWLCSFINKCNSLENDIFSIRESLCGIVSLKYPMACGHCMQSRCVCDPIRMDTIRDKSAAYITLLDKRKLCLKSFEDFTIDECCKMFYNIYVGRIHIQTLENIGFHFLEEIGEAAICVRQLSQLRGITDDSSTGIDLAFLEQLSTVKDIVENYAKYCKELKIDNALTKPDMLRARVLDAKMGLVNEIGDSFSWFCSILNKLSLLSDSIYNNPKEKPKLLDSLEEVLNKEYIDTDGNPKCPSCKSNPCKCVFYNVK